MGILAVACDAIEEIEVDLKGRSMAGKAAKSAAKLTAKQEIFCKEYLIDLNGTQAAIRAGYSEKTARQIAEQNLSKLDIQNRVSELKQSRNAQLDVDGTYVLKRLIEWDQLDVLDILTDTGGFNPISEWPKVWRTSISAMDVSTLMKQEEDIETRIMKVKWPDKVKNLELIGKHVDVQAFKDKVDLSSEDGTMSPKSTLTTEQVKELIKSGSEKI